MRRGKIWISSKAAAVIILCISLALSFPSYRKAVDASQIRHGEDEWTVLDSESAGYAPDLLEKAAKYVGKTEATGFIVVKDGEILLEKYYRGQRPGDFSYGGRMANSLLSALIGIAVENRYLGNIDQKVVDFFPGEADFVVDSRMRNVTVKNLLTMTGGFGKIPDEIFHKTRWVYELLNLPLDFEPGSRFQYAPEATYLLSGIISRSTGMHAEEFAGRFLLEPVKASGLIWHSGPEGYNTGGEYMYMKPVDMAKFGYLYLNRGRWKERQVLPEKWVEESLGGQVGLEGLVEPLEDGCMGFGYNFILRTEGGYRVYSVEGDGEAPYLWIVPELKMVIVVTTYHSLFKPAFDLADMQYIFENYLAKAVNSNREDKNGT